MNNQFITTKELNEKVQEFLSAATVADKKWLYCYFSEFDEFPIVTDEIKTRKRRARCPEDEEDAEVIEEKCPF